MLSPVTLLNASKFDILPGFSHQDAQVTRHVFSIDVEEWFHVGAYENDLSRNQWPSLESRVEGQMSLLLDMLAEVTTKATLFWLGNVAKLHPRLLRRAVAAGHEIAAHGLDHQRLFTLDFKARRDDIATTKKILEDITGIAVIGYRAPSFSLTPDVWNTYNILADLGFSYSSSIYPLKTDHYGYLAAPRSPFYPIGDKRIIEIPMTVLQVLGRRFPAAGGGYFRLMPKSMGSRVFFKGSKQTNSPGIFYMHPWEIDPAQPRIITSSFKSRFRHHVNQKNMLGKVRAVLKKSSFGPVRDIILPSVKTSNADRLDCR